MKTPRANVPVITMYIFVMALIQLKSLPDENMRPGKMIVPT